MISYTPIRNYIHTNNQYHLDILRLDILHPEVSGNKWFKLKANIDRALKENYNTVLTFGGPHSNHLAAAASACAHYGLRSVGVVRGGEEFNKTPTLIAAEKLGMKLEMVSRKDYALKNEANYLKTLSEKFGRSYVIPEGGNNCYGLKGCMEIVDTNWDYDYVICACGTGTTFGGIVSSLKKAVIAVGINVLKGENQLPEDVNQQLRNCLPSCEIQVAGNEELHKKEIEKHFITNEYCFNGFAGCDEKLIAFKKEFETKHKIPLDYLYTNKLAFAIYDLMEKEKFRANSKLLMIHSGGLQGNPAFEKRYHLNPIL